MGRIKTGSLRESESRLEQHIRIKERLKTLPDTEFGKLRAGCLESLSPYMRKRIEKFSPEKLAEHPSFLDYCGDNL